MGYNLFKRFVDAFSPDTKEDVNTKAETMAKVIGRDYEPEERVLVLKGLYTRLLAQLQTEEEEAENKAKKCKTAIKELKSKQLKLEL